MMNPRVAHVTALPDYQLDLTFTNHERKIFDVKPYLTIGVFEELQDVSLFNAVKPANGSIFWPNNLDLDPDRLYLESYSLA
jgi:Protein of unknown function (DUF2442)